MPAADAWVYRVPLRTRFRGIDVRDGVLVRGPAGWGEFSPFWDYDVAESRRWWAAAVESAVEGWPDPVRTSVPVNVTVPAVDAERAHAIVAASGCRTAKVKVAEPGQTRRRRPGAGRGGARRPRARRARSGSTPTPPGTSTPPSPASRELDARRAWSTSSSRAPRSRSWSRCAAGSTSGSPPTRWCGGPADPLRVDLREACDVVVLKVQPLGGVRAALRVAEAHGLPCVVSSALECSVGIAAGVALAAALPELPFACGLATVALFTDDVSSTPLLPVDGALPVVRPEPDRLDAVAADAGDRGRGGGPGSTAVRGVNPSTAFARVLVDELLRGGVTDAVLAPGLPVRAGRAGPGRRRAGRPAAAARAHRRADGGVPRARPGQGVRAGRCRC